MGSLARALVAEQEEEIMTADSQRVREEEDERECATACAKWDVPQAGWAI